MQNAFRFETPENVQVQYEPAGLGTRFIAWFVDQVVVWLITAALMIFLAVAGFSFDFLFDDNDRRDPADSQRVVFYFFGLMMLVWGLGSFLYFGGSELFLRGQTIGKRLLRIRVIKASGFQLDAASILIRNIFRVVDHLPPMWIFPVVSRHSQRAGDMVAGTLVVCDSQATLSSVRATLSSRQAADAEFRFDGSQLKRLSGDDFQAIERFLDRWRELPLDQQATLLPIFAQRIAAKLKIEQPPEKQQHRFLEDLLAAELRRQERSLV
jgi:uncharacterized RDD family membrane protein YckC